jgi:ribbon-helix-helix CopG family protein
MSRFDVRINLKVERDLRDQIAQEAFVRGVSISDVIREILKKNYNGGSRAA